MICWLCLAVRRCKHFHLFFNFFQAASLHFPFSISILSQIKFSKTWYWSFFLLWYLYSLLNPPRARYQQIVPPQICAEKGGLIINENFTLLLKQTHVLNTCRCRIHNFQVRYSQPFQHLTVNYLQRSTTVDYIHSLFFKILFFYIS